MNDRLIIPIKVLQTSENKFIPFWELTAEQDDDLGVVYKIKAEWRTHYADLQDAFYNMETKEISAGIVKESYPEKTEFAIDEEIYLEVKHNAYKEAKIVDIVFDTYETLILNSNKLEGYERKIYFKENEEIKSGLYEIRRYKPTYILDTGEKILHEYRLKHKVK